MAISFVSTASAATTTVAMPTHAAGDLIVAFAFNKNSVTNPVVPAGWVQGLAPTGANVCSMTFACKIAASGNETTGTWTNASGITVAVYRKDSWEAWTTPVLMIQAGTGATLDYSGLNFFGPYQTVPQSHTEIWLLRFAGHRTATDLLTNTPASWTARGGVATSTRVMDSNGPTITYNEYIGGLTQAVNASSGWYTASVQIEVWDGKGIVCMGSDGSTSTTLTMPLHAAGDLIIGYSDRVSATPPSLPAGYTDLSNGNANTFSSRLAYKVATSSAEAAPVFTNGANSTVSIYRNPTGVWDTVDVGTNLNGLSTALNFSGSTVPPVPGQVTGFLRFESVNAAHSLFLTGWSMRSLWPNSPGLIARDSLNEVNEADMVGANSLTITSAAWRTNTIRIAYNSNVTVENTNQTNVSVPAGVKGCYVTLIGGGGGGASGATRNGSVRPSGYGGGGGGGGAAIKRVFIPAASLGSTYSVSRGAGGAATTATSQNGNSGNSSTFVSGSVSLSAGGGSGGTISLTPTGGGGGTYSGLGSFSYDAAENGASGGAGGTTSPTAGTAGSASTYAGAGGGGGGANISSGFNGGIGGNSTFASGGAAGVAAGGVGGSPVSAGSGNGGAGAGGGAGGSGATNGGVGGTGGTYGAGGGGGGGKEGSFSGAAALSGAGAIGYTLIEWVPPDSGQFFKALDSF